MSRVAEPESYADLTMSTRSLGSRSGPSHPDRVRWISPLCAAYGLIRLHECDPVELGAWFADTTETAASASRKKHDVAIRVEGDDRVAAAKPVTPTHSIGLPAGWVEIFDDTFKTYPWPSLCRRQCRGV